MIRRLLRDRTAASAAEFALVLPLLLLFIFGIIDAGRFMWTFNEAEKATQMGARMAVVVTPISPGLSSSYVGVDGLTQGDLIGASELGKVTCTGSGSGAGTTASCSCTTTPCPTLGTADPVPFRAIVERMKLFLPQVTASNVAVEYSSSGLGFAGNPNGPDISPLVTVKIGTPATAVQFTPITSLLLASVNMPNFTTTLSAEDLSGSQSN
jgi:hypothetical protein